MPLPELEKGAEWCGGQLQIFGGHFRRPHLPL